MPVRSNILLAPLSALYGVVTRARLGLYRAGALRTERIDAPVISVGNITTGGTGKTPLVAWLARRVNEMGERVCILTRGYGRANPSAQIVVSDGSKLLAEARDGGDEPRLLAEMLLGASAVISHADRASAARWALKNLNSTAFILDDGFQHLAIARDLNLVTIDATNPWGGGRLLPRGRLREPLRGLARADALILTRAEQARDLAAVRDEALRLSGGRPVFASQTRTVRTRLLMPDSDEIKEAPFEALPQPVAAFCALGNPQAFFAHLRADGYTLAHTNAFRDHHVYTPADANRLSREAVERGAHALVTTAKDAVKLRGLGFELPCYVIEIDVSFDDEPKLLELLKQALQRRGAEKSQR
ncbi:MAG: tetraacyldisaccharide 4'-kinase [Acidobacteria bacterium]|nr:tetraacyldisaccharide 4'-kinase [Acidobacteriota bacterium]